MLDVNWLKCGNKQTNKRMILFKCMCALDWTLINGPMWNKTHSCLLFPHRSSQNKALCIRVGTTCLKNKSKSPHSPPAAIVQIHSSFLSV